MALLSNLLIKSKPKSTCLTHQKILLIHLGRIYTTTKQNTLVVQKKILSWSLADLNFIEEQPALNPSAVVIGRRIRNIIIAVLITTLVVGGFIFADFLSHRQVSATDIIIIEE